MKRIPIANLEALATWIKNWKSSLQKKQVIRLIGPMGVGKTQFVELLLKEFHSHEVSSPSFIIQNRYKIAQGFVTHIDLFRLKSEEDLESTGFWDLFDEDEGIIIIEWADLLPEDVFSPLWSVQTIEMEFDPINSESRILKLPVKE